MLLCKLIIWSLLLPLYAHISLPLVYSRGYLDICLFNNVYNVNISNFNCFTRNSLTHNSVDPLRRILIASNVQYQKSYFNRVVYLWNNLPPHFQLIKDLSVFIRTPFTTFLYYAIQQFWRRKFSHIYSDV